MTRLLEEVALAIQGVAAEVLEPAFARREDLQAWEKSAGEVVTAADVEAERRLGLRLAELQPGAPMVGEEATAREPTLPARWLAEAPRVWLVDPLDGTANFIAGSPDWAVMVALVEHGLTMASWMWRPADRHLFVAERGSGASLNGQQLFCPAAPHEVGELTGAILTRYFDETTKSTLTRNTHRFAHVTPGRRCVGVEYPMIAQGHQHFALFHRTLPWDHAPGVLLIEEAGGRACRLDGTVYRPAQTTSGLLIAADEPTWTTVRDNLLDSTQQPNA